MYGISNSIASLNNWLWCRDTSCASNWPWWNVRNAHVYYFTWWRHQMETFSVLLAICAGNSPVPGEFPTQRPVMRSFEVEFDLRPNKRLSKQSWGWWFETPSRPLWRHRNEKQVCWLIISVLNEQVSYEHPIMLPRRNSYNNTSRLRKYGQHFEEVILKCIFFKLF